MSGNSMDFSAEQQRASFRGEGVLVPVMRLVDDKGGKLHEFSRPRVQRGPVWELFTPRSTKQTRKIAALAGNSTDEAARLTRSMNARREGVMIRREAADGTVREYYRFPGLSELVEAVKVWQVFDKFAERGECAISVSALRAALDRT